MDRVLDNNHGIDSYDNSHSEPVYVPWYTRSILGSRNGYETNYYTRVGGWERVECKSWEAAYNHIARSRRMPTSKDVRSTYVQEAQAAGVSVDPSARTDPSERIVWSAKTAEVIDATPVCEVCKAAPATTTKNDLFMCDGCSDDFDPWYHPRYDDNAEFDYYGG